MKARLKQLLKFILFFGFGIFLIWWFFRGLTIQEKAEIKESFLQANYWIILLSILVGIVSYFLRAARWKMLLEPMGYHPKKGNTLMAILIGYFGNLAFPRLGEVLRCGILDRYDRIPFTKSLGTVITERIIDTLLFVLIFFATVIIEYDLATGYLASTFHIPDIGSKLIILGIAALLFLGIIAFIGKRFFSHTKIYQKILVFIKNIGEGLVSLKNLKRPGLFIFYSVMLWVCYFFTSYIVFFSMSETSSLSPSAALACLTFGTISVIVTPGGIGLFPTLISQTLVLYGISKTGGYAMGWMIWISQNIVIILGGLTALILISLVNKGHSSVKQQED